jgi:hypothetical protein
MVIDRFESSNLSPLRFKLDLLEIIGCFVL